MPCTPPNNPEAKKEVGDCMGCDGITETTLKNNQCLIGQSAQNPGEPFVMGEAKNHGGDHKRPRNESVQWHRHEFFTGDKSIYE